MGSLELDIVSNAHTLPMDGHLASTLAGRERPWTVKYIGVPRIFQGSVLTLHPGHDATPPLKKVTEQGGWVSDIPFSSSKFDGKLSIINSRSSSGWARESQGTCIIYHLILDAKTVTSETCSAPSYNGRNGRNISIISLLLFCALANWYSGLSCIRTGYVPQ